MERGIFVEMYRKMESGKAYLTLRVDGSYERDTVQALQEKLGVVHKLLMFKETGDQTGKPHIQGMMVVDEMSKQQLDKLRYTVRTHFGVKASQFSVAKIKKYDEYTAYIVKQHDCLYNFGVTQEELDDFNKRQQEIESKMKSKGRKKGSNPMLDLVNAYKEHLEKCLTKYNYEHLDKKERNEIATDRHISKFVFEWYGPIAVKPFCKNRMVEAVRCIKACVLEGDARKAYKAEVVERMCDQLAAYNF